MRFPNRSFLAVTTLVIALSACNSNGASNPSLDGNNGNLPALGTSFINTDLGGSVTRLSDSRSQPITAAGHIIKADYSRVQAENADGSLLLVYAANAEGLLQYALLSPLGGTAELISLPNGNASGLSTLHDEAEARWHPTDSNLIRFISGQNSYNGSLKVFEYDIADKSVAVIADLTGKLPASWGPELYGSTNLEGTFSNDGNRLAWAIETGVNNAETLVGYVAFDIRNGGEVLGTLEDDGRDQDHLSISPSGEYVVISAASKTTVHPVDFSSERRLLNETQHSDFCVTTQGNDCYISVSFDDASDSNYGWIFSSDLVTGQTTRLFNVFASGNTSLHLSGRSFDRPGWALLSTYNCQSNTSKAKCNRLSLIEIKDNPRIIDLTGTHSSGDGYYAEPQATISRDGLRAYFNSDWDRSNSVNVFRLDIPASTYTGE